MHRHRPAGPRARWGWRPWPRPRRAPGIPSPPPWPGPDGPARAAAEAEDGAAGARIPVGASEPGEGGDHHHALAGLDRAGQGFEIAGPLDDAQAVPEPLHTGPGHEDRSLEGVGHRGTAGRRPRSAPRATSPSVPRSQASVVTRPSIGSGQCGPAFIRTKLPVPKVTLVMPRSKHAWPNRAACWSPAIPLIGHSRRGESPPSAPAETVRTARRTDAPREGRRPARRRGRPVRSDHLRTTMSNSRVRDALVASVAKTPPSDPPVRFHRTQESTVPRTTATPPSGPGREAALVEEPPHLGGGEVRIEDQAGPLPDQREVAGLAELPTGGGGAAVLPDDGPVEWSTRAPVPGHHGLPLVGDADGLATRP